MSRKYKPRTGTIIYRTPQREEVWLVVDRDRDHNGRESERKFENSVQGGTRTCIVVSNNTGNLHSPTVEVVFTTTKDKAKLPTHFTTYATPEPSTVLCEAVDTVPKKDLVKYYGRLTKQETAELNRCLKISLAL